MAKMLTDLMGGELTVASTPGQGATFRVKLFLPEVHGGPARVRKPAPAQRRTYLGARRKVLVVDNEETDRELLVQLLEPLGFVLRTAASGHDCLDLLATGYRPDAIFMDLAMPGIDGWETLRRIGALRLPGLHCAVVSSNAFDRGLPNDVGIGAGDYFIKPVRRSDLLDWLTRRLGLQWAPPAATQDEASDRPRALAAPEQAAITTIAQTTGGAPGSAPLPPPEALQPLQRAVALGYYRGVLKAADALAQADPGWTALAARVRELAGQFRFEAIAELIGPAAPPADATAAAPPPTPQP